MENYGIQMAQGTLKRVVVLRLKPGTDVLLGLTEACKRAGINNGVIISCIGSLDDVKYCNPVELPTKAGFQAWRVYGILLYCVKETIISYIQGKHFP